MIMKNNNPRGKTPSLIGSTNGKPKKVAVKRKSKCNRCQSDILTGQDCFSIPKVGSGFKSEKRYCTTCFQKIIEQTEKDLENIKNLMSIN